MFRWLSDLPSPSIRLSMNVSSVTSTAQTQTVSMLPSPSSTSDSCSASDAASSTTSISKMGDLMKQLQSLETSDPDKAKAVMTTIASQLTDKANATGDSHMKALADKFTQAAQTGDMSSLQAPQGQGAQSAQGAHHGGHHHHHGGGGGSDQSKAQSYTSTDQDPMEQVESIISGALGST
jgi:hypothetical protein